MFTIMTLGFTDESDQKGTPIATSEEFETREKAEEYLNSHMKQFKTRGYNEEHDYWWARDEGDKYRSRRFYITLKPVDEFLKDAFVD